jgi:anti-anti-sigma factor
MSAPAMTTIARAPLRIDGEMTIFRAAELKPLLLATPAPTAVDLSEVTEIDSAGLQLLLVARREALAQQREFHLVAPSRAVVDLLALLELSALFGVAPGDTAAPAAGENCHES